MEIPQRLPDAEISQRILRSPNFPSVVILVIEHWAYSACGALEQLFGQHFLPWVRVTVCFVLKVSCTLYFFVKACGRGELSLMRWILILRHAAIIFSFFCVARVRLLAKCHWAGASSMKNMHWPFRRRRGTMAKLRERETAPAELNRT